MKVNAIVKARAIGGSIVVRIPAEIAKVENIREGELVKIEVEKAKKSYFGVFKGMKPFKHEKFSDFD